MSDDVRPTTMKQIRREMARRRKPFPGWTKSLRDYIRDSYGGGGQRFVGKAAKIAEKS